MIYRLIGLDLMDDLTGRPPAGLPPHLGNGGSGRRANRRRIPA
ncbi:hypothetical protein APR08_004325 [Nocardia amikacinitolerans]|nr:hypothetical protein [Nocardia amikacinitolerans]